MNVFSNHIDFIFFMIIHSRKLNEVLTVMLYDDSSDSSTDEDYDFLLLSTLFPEPNPRIPRLNLADLTESQCDDMFR